jgi:hypothetical protein
MYCTTASDLIRANGTEKTRTGIEPKMKPLKYNPPSKPKHPECQRSDFPTRETKPQNEGRNQSKRTICVGAQPTTVTKGKNQVALEKASLILAQLTFVQLTAYFTREKEENGTSFHHKRKEEEETRLLTTNHGLG